MLYHKIQTIFKRTERGELILGDWTDPVFHYLRDRPWRCTEKVDGTNIRVLIDTAPHGMAGNGPHGEPEWIPKVTFGGRNEGSQLPAPLVEWLTEKFHDPDMLRLLGRVFPDGAVLFGEGYGAGIQKGGKRYGLEQQFVLFDVNVGGYWLEHHNVLDVAHKLYLSHVPVVGYHTLGEAIELVRNGFDSCWGSFSAEGLVAEPSVQLFDRKGQRVITKLKTKDFARAVGSLDE